MPAALTAQTDTPGTGVKEATPKLPKRHAASGDVRSKSGCPADRGIYVRKKDGAKFTVYRYGIRDGRITYTIFAGRLNGRRAYYVRGIAETGTGWAESYFELSDPAFRSVKWQRPDKRLDAEDLRPGMTDGPLEGSWKFTGCRSLR
jgi:hypothetical protein